MRNGHEGATLKQVIAGIGEIGYALAGVLADNDYEVWCVDEGTEYTEWYTWWMQVEDLPPELAVRRDELTRDSLDDIGILHICFPWSDGFLDAVREYQSELEPAYTIIHSTVPVGTSRQCGAIHSPVMGRHPHLEEAIRETTKFLGGEKASEVADVFRRAGVEVYLTDKPESTELMKLISTTYLGVLVEYTKDVKRTCHEYGVPFELFTIWTDEYNRGAKSLGYGQVARPNLVPIMTEVGGHCVLNNCDLLDTPFTRLVKELNATDE